jgi:hypothetical protein
MQLSQWQHLNLIIPIVTFKIEAFEAYMQAAQDNGAVNLKRERGYHIDGRIERVDLTDLGKLALFLGISTQDDLLSKARASLSGIVEEFHVLNEVLENWRQLKKYEVLIPKTSKIG